MPQQKLVGSSTFLTRNGWRRLTCCNSTVSVVGVDRSGGLSEGMVDVHFAGQVNTVAYVGSETALGRFHPETKLVSSTGISLRIDSLVNEGQIGDLRFENAHYFSGYILNHDTIAALWEEIEAAAVMRRECEIILPARGEIPPKIDGRFGQFIGGGNSDLQPTNMKYIRMDEPTFKSAMTDSFVDTICQFFSIFFEETESGDATFDIENYILCLWYQFILEIDGKATPCLRYDSLQYSNIVTLDHNSAASHSGLSKGGTAFVRAYGDAAYEISWQDPSWNPISSGFILPAA